MDCAAPATNPDPPPTCHSTLVAGRRLKHSTGAPTGPMPGAVECNPAYRRRQALRFGMEVDVRPRPNTTRVVMTPRHMPLIL